MAKINHLIRHVDQVRRELVEQEKHKAEAARLAATAERDLKHLLGGSIITSRYEGRRILTVAPTPHPSDAGHKRLTSPAGQMSDKTRGWVGCLPGSFEAGRR
jgi:hypothetical protein